MPRVMLDRMVAINEPSANSPEQAPSGTNRPAPGGPSKAEVGLRECNASNIRAFSLSIPPRSGGWFLVISKTRGKSGSPHDVIATPLAAYCLVGQAGDLLRDQSDEEHDHRRAEQQGAHVGESTLDHVSPCVPCQAHRNERRRDRREQLQRRIQ